jgi:hypothetical protein
MLIEKWNRRIHKAREIEELLEKAEETPDSEIDRILDKAANFGGLTHLEAASLLKMDARHSAEAFSHGKTY